MKYLSSIWHDAAGVTETPFCQPCPKPAHVCHCLCSCNIEAENVKLRDTLREIALVHEPCNCADSSPHCKGMCVNCGMTYPCETTLQLRKVQDL